MILVRPGDLLVSGINAAKGAIAIHDAVDLGPIAATIHYGSYEVDTTRAHAKFLWWMLRSKFFREILSEHVPGGIKTELKAKRLLPVPVPLPPLDEQRRIVARIEELAAKVEEARGLRGQSAEERPLLADAFLRERFGDFAKHYSPAALDQVLVDAAYGTSEKSYADRPNDSIPVLRIPNVASEKLRLDDMKYAQITPRAIEALTLKDGDILIVRTNGSIDLVGRSAVVEGLPEASVYASYLIRLRFDDSKLTPEFAQIGLRHLRRSGALVDLARTTAGQYNVSLGRLRGATLPIPPLSLQRQAVAELDALQAKVDAVKALQTETAAELDAMLPAILDKTFKGEL